MLGIFWLIKYASFPKHRFAFGQGSKFGFEGIDADDGLWHHYVVVYDTDACYLYVDGGLADSDDANDSASATAFAYIGINSSYSSRLDGDITEIRTYDKALTAGEVRSLFILPRGPGKISPAMET